MYMKEIFRKLLEEGFSGVEDFCVFVDAYLYEFSCTRAEAEEKTEDILISLCTDV